MNETAMPTCVCVVGGEDVGCRVWTVVSDRCRRSVGRSAHLLLGRRQQLIDRRVQALRAGADRRRVGRHYRFGPAVRYAASPVSAWRHYTGVAAYLPDTATDDKHQWNIKVDSTRWSAHLPPPRLQFSRTVPYNRVFSTFAFISYINRQLKYL